MIININKDSSHSSNFTCDSCPLDALLNVSQAELEAHAPLLLTLHKPWTTHRLRNKSDTVINILLI